MGRYGRNRAKQSSKAAFIITILASLLVGIGGTFYVVQNYKNYKIGVVADSNSAIATETILPEKFPAEQQNFINERELIPVLPESAPIPDEVKISEHSELPDLLGSDNAFRKTLLKLSPGLSQWLNTNLLIRKYVIILNDFSQGLRIYKHVSFLRFEEYFSVEQGENGLQIAPKSYHRYDQLAQDINAIDSKAAMAVYLKFRPLMMQVFSEFSYPEDITLETLIKKAASEIIAAPLIEGQIAVVRPSLFYKFADPALEALNPLQKQMLRMGMENTRIIQNKCREFLVELGRSEYQ
jgi:Protein of unknown function (DUF3014)